MNHNPPLQTTHGLSHTPEWTAWSDMRRRCRDANRKNYHRYGGRGIKVCARWRRFENFFADVGRRPSPEHSLGRIRNDGNYEPSNVEWQTPEQQGNNRSTNRIVIYHGVEMTLAQAVKNSPAKITRTIAKFRLKRGWPVDKTFDTLREREPRMRANG